MGAEWCGAVLVVLWVLKEDSCFVSQGGVGFMVWLGGWAVDAGWEDAERDDQERNSERRKSRLREVAKREESETGKERTMRCRVARGGKNEKKEEGEGEK
ncbi:hypothetical protein Tco_0403620 [Tanacetum coccineum]